MRIRRTACLVLLLVSIPLVSCCILFLFFHVYFAYVPEGDHGLKADVSNADELPRKTAAGAGALVSRERQKKEAIAYVVSVTGCGKDDRTGWNYIAEGAAVLRHSIMLASRKYDFKMYAMVHPNATECGMDLEQLGYEILVRNSPVRPENIKSEYLRTRIQQSGCCGDAELIKLEVYTLTNHPIAVHLDLDTLVLKPMDDLFDLMLGKTHDASRVAVMWKDRPLPHSIGAFFTKDYNLVQPRRKIKPTQGGFLVVKPSMTVYNDFVDILKVGDFREGHGWGGQVGPFHGAMTIQGILPYYYEVLNKSSSVELNRCVFNQMSDGPRIAPRNKEKVGKCRSGERDCEDCREQSIDNIVTVHYTTCQKPWWCFPMDHDKIQQRLCRKMIHEWYRLRSDLEKSWGRSGFGPGTFNRDHYYGYCTRFGRLGYRLIEKPYGSPVRNISTVAAAHNN